MGILEPFFLGLPDAQLVCFYLHLPTQTYIPYSFVGIDIEHLGFAPLEEQYFTHTPKNERIRTLKKGPKIKGIPSSNHQFSGDTPPKFNIAPEK